MKKVINGLIVCFLAALAAALFAACFESSVPRTAEYTITYHLNGGKPKINEYYKEIDDDTVMVQIQQIVPPTGGYKPLEVERETWFFDGWYTDSDCTQEYTILPADNTFVHLYAKWSDKITVTKDNFKDYFNVSSRWNGGLTIPGAAIVYSFTPKYTPDPARSEGSIKISATPHLSSWHGNTNLIILNAENDFTYSSAAAIDREVQFHLYDSTLNYALDFDSVDLYLLHKDPIPVTLELDGGTLENNVVSMPGGDTLKKDALPVPVKEGYRFMGWYVDSEYKMEFADTKITREISVYAKFTKEVVISFDTKGGSEKENLFFLVDRLLQLGEAPTKENYAFAGWYTDPECTEKFTEKVASESRTLYARWEPYRIITFDTKGGNPKESMTYHNGQTVMVGELGEAVHEEGYIFDGWFTDPACEHKYDGGTITSDITLYPRWCVKYNGLSSQTTEKFDRFFNVELTFKRENNKLITNVSLELKEEFQNFYFRLIFTVEGHYIGDDGTDYGNFLEDVIISTLNGNVSYAFERELGYQYTGYEKTDHIDLTYYHSWSEIRLPVGYEVGE